MGVAAAAVTQALPVRTVSQCSKSCVVILLTMTQLQYHAIWVIAFVMMGWAGLAACSYVRVCNTCCLVYFAGVHRAEACRLLVCTTVIRLGCLH